MKQTEVIEYSTFYKIKKEEGINYENLVKNFSVLNYYSQDYDAYGYKNYKTHFRCMKVSHKEITRYLADCGLEANIIRRDDFPFKKLDPFMMKNDPKDDIQRDVIKNVMSAFKLGENRAIISLKTGKGKTYVATNLIHKLGVKTLIMVKSENLKRQWYQSFMTHTTCKNVVTVDKIADLIDLLELKNANPDIVICTHRSMSMFVNDYGIGKFSYLIMKLGIGLKVYDEFDLENASMYNMDMNSSTKFNLYLSATDYKSSHHENKVFKKIFESVYNVGKEYENESKRNGVFILKSSKPSQKQRALCMQYTTQGFAFSYQKFHEYIVNNFTYKEEIKLLWENFIKKRFDKKLKTIFFIGRKTTAEEFKRKLLEILPLKEDDIGIYNSDVRAEEKSMAVTKYIIISTSKSLGRGVDLKGLDTVIDFETRNSKSETNQVIGRVSRTGMDNIGTYIQFVDSGFETSYRNYTNKMMHGFFDEFFTNIKVLDLDGGKSTIKELSSM